MQSFGYGPFQPCDTSFPYIALVATIGGGERLQLCLPLRSFAVVVAQPRYVLMSYDS
jgi:hypothetical protein